MDTINILRCPTTHRPLQLKCDGVLSTDRSSSYSVVDGIAVVLPKTTSTNSNIIDYYDTFGWTPDADGVAGERKEAVDSRAPSYDYSRKCMSRLQKYFIQGGEYLLDVGSGAIPHDEYMSYHSRFRKRVCVDLSIKGLQQAKLKLGDRGEYVVGDATNLPFLDDSFDAVTCNHVVYQIPAEMQTAAMMEIWRVLKPGGVAVVVYRWQWSPIAARLANVAQKIGLGTDPQTSSSSSGEAAPARYPDHPQARSWFEAQNWPFQYSYDCYRVVDNEFMRRYCPDDWRGRLLLNTLYAGQVLVPKICGKYGSFSVMVIRKPKQ
jgi:SAM-dependent methyltransferase